MFMLAHVLLEKWMYVVARTRNSSRIASITESRLTLGKFLARFRITRYSMRILICFAPARIHTDMPNALSYAASVCACQLVRGRMAVLHVDITHHDQSRVAVTFSLWCKCRSSVLCPWLRNSKCFRIISVGVHFPISFVALKKAFCSTEFLSEFFAKRRPWTLILAR